jgi:hypothetical protein
MSAQSGELLPRLPAIPRAEQGGVLDPGVDRVRVGQRWFEMPDARELPGVRRAVVPLVGPGDAVVHELVPHRLPRLAPVAGALDQLPEPAGGLRRVQPIRVSGRSLEVVDLPAPEVGATDVPPVARSIRHQDERALARPNQYPYPAHPLLPSERPEVLSRPAPDATRYLWAPPLTVQSNGPTRDRHARRIARAVGSAAPSGPAGCRFRAPPND